jgi:hypothetical protein
MDEKIPELIASYRELIKTLGATDSSKLEKLVDELEEAYILPHKSGILVPYLDMINLDLAEREDE